LERRCWQVGQPPVELPVESMPAPKQCNAISIMSYL
jgi:hypothetical protein